jgi:hypothetical protein
MKTLSDGYKLPKNVTSIGNSEIEDIEIGLELAGKNPFSYQTEVSYQLSEEVYVKLDVFSISGKMVSSIVDDHLPQGEYVATITGEKLESGIYIVRLQAGNKLVTRKITLLK